MQLCDVLFSAATHLEPNMNIDINSSTKGPATTRPQCCCQRYEEKAPTPLKIDAELLAVRLGHAPMAEQTPAVLPSLTVSGPDNN